MKHRTRKCAWNEVIIISVYLTSLPPAMQDLLFLGIFNRLSEVMAAEEVPPELLLQIFSSLSPSDSLRIYLTCKTWNNVWKDSTLWKRWHKEYLGGKPFSPLQRGDWRRSFKQNFKQLNSFSNDVDKLFFAIERNRLIIAEPLVTKKPFLIKASMRKISPGKNRGKSATQLFYPLQAAARAGKLTMFKMLWEKFYFPSSQQGSSDSDVLKQLAREEKLKLDYRLDLALKECVVHGNLAILQFLVEVSPYMRKQIRTDNSLLVDACKGKGDLNRITNTIKLMLQHGAELAHEQIRVALLMKKLDLVHWLLDRLNTPEPLNFNNWRRDMYPLLGLAVENGNRPIIKRLLANGETVESGQWHALIRNCFEIRGFRQVDQKVVKWICRKKILTEEGLSIEGEREDLVNNLLLFLCKQIFQDGDVDLLRFMITMGLVDTNRRDEEDMTLLQKAARGGHVVMVKALLACGAEPQLPPRRKRGSGPNISEEIQERIKQAIDERAQHGVYTKTSGDEEESGGGRQQGQKRKQREETKREKEKEAQNKERRLE